MSLPEVLIATVGAASVFAATTIHRHQGMVARAERMLATQERMWDRARCEITNVRHELEVTKMKLKYDCNNTWFDRYRCELGIGHVGVHTDGEVAWYNEVQFPVQVKESV